MTVINLLGFFSARIAYMPFATCESAGSFFCTPILHSTLIAFFIQFIFKLISQQICIETNEIYQKWCLLNIWLRTKRIYTQILHI